MTIRVPLDSGQPEFWAIVNTLGQSVLLETLKMAAYYVTHSNSAPKSRRLFVEITEARSCYASVQGSGLNIIIKKFGLDYDPDHLRENFNYYLRRSA